MVTVTVPSATVEVDGIELGEALQRRSELEAVEFLDAVLEGMRHPEELGDEAAKHLHRLTDLRAFVLYAGGGHYEP